MRRGHRVADRAALHNQVEVARERGRDPRVAQQHGSRRDFDVRVVVVLGILADVPEMRRRRLADPQIDREPSCGRINQRVQKLRPRGEDAS